MIIISSREFRENQKKYFDLADQHEEVLVQRGKSRSCFLYPNSGFDKIAFDNNIIHRIRESLEQIKKGEVIRVEKENIRSFLGI